ncbi:MAG TPA: exodeoxyribonuclease V subunit beta [Desulfobacterales bacterium]|nr:exodeoxyribonuclease V subunit beta [Desulfobacterales bacterium]
MVIKTLDNLTLPLNGICLIEAGAGTGKTYTIAALYLRLILGHGASNAAARQLMPPEILVVTFTNAATEELRERIRRRLVEGAAFFRGEGAGDDFLHGLRAAYAEDDWLRQARFLARAAQWMDEAAIHTIHAWCQRMLRQHAFASGSLFDLELDCDEDELMIEAARDYWRSYLYALPVGELTDLTETCGCFTPGELLRKLGPWLALSALPPGPEPFSMLKERQQAIAAARSLWAGDLTAALDKLRAAQAVKDLNGNKYRTNTLEKYLAEIVSWVEDGALPSIQALEKLSHSALKDGTAKNGCTPEHPAYTGLDVLRSELARLEIRAAFFIHAARYLQQRLEMEKERRSRIGFNDLLHNLHRALRAGEGGRRLARIISRQFPVVMIDEFQDTDPVQYGIFSRIFRPAESALLMIGDPKQAIYSFRGADIHTYLRARRDAASLYTLGTNYRSTPAAVEAVNRIFAAGERYSGGSFLFGDEIPGPRLEAHGREESLLVEDEVVEGVKIWLLEQEAPVNKVGPAGYMGRMAAAAAAEIVRLLNLAADSKARFISKEGGQRQLRPADIAVLVRDINEARAIREALRERRVLSAYLSDKESVFKGPEARDLLYLLRACAMPERERLLKAALAVSLLERSPAWLDKLNDDSGQWELEVERFRHYREIWQRRGVLSMLRALFRDFGVARNLVAGGGERVLTNIFQLSELLQEAAGGLEGEQGLIRWLTVKINDTSQAVGEEEIIRLESDEDLVKVVTIHKAKGLEYGLVFLPFICNARPLKAKNGPLLYRDMEGKEHLTLAPDAEETAAADRERLAEDLRLLYVALTRAQYACWLGVGVMGRSKKGGDVSNLHYSALGYLLSGGREISLPELPGLLDEMRGDCPHLKIMPLPAAGSTPYRPPKTYAELGGARKFGGIISNNWRITSYSAILHGGLGQGRSSDSGLDFYRTLIEEESRERELTVSPVIHDLSSAADFPKGPAAGTFLHDLLEWAAGDFAGLAVDGQRLQREIDKRCRRRNWQQWSGVLADWLGALLTAPIIPGDGRGALADLRPDALQAELEFMFAIHDLDLTAFDTVIRAGVIAGRSRPPLNKGVVNGMLKGFIDLLFCYQGRYFVLDYKSNYLGAAASAYNDENMVRAMLEHRYDLQYTLYTVAMHRLLKSRLPDYSYERDVGGVLYLFLRGVEAPGHGVYADKPGLELVEWLDNLLRGE